MGDLRLVSTHKCQLKPLMEGSLFNELRLLEVGIRRTEQKLLEFEEKYHLATQEFISRYENDEMEETTNVDEWIGEFRLLTRLREKADVLRGIRFAN
ncbi:MAG: hypothetical protein J7M30_01880 [Deltaproteobacteria bacterium]|nr:hypothetical protein [Deltaproteobacteria bacterium]